MSARVSTFELRLVLASIGVLSFSVAWLTAAMTGAHLDHCLPWFQSAEIHCPACYLAIFLLATAVAPWPKASTLKAE